MSIVYCQHCDKFIDSDFDDTCFMEDGSIICESCQEAAYERQQERLMEDGPPDTSREDQQLRDAGRGHLIKP